MKNKEILLSISAVVAVLGIAGLYFLNRDVSPTTASTSTYKSQATLTQNNKYPNFQEISCLTPNSEGRIVEAFILHSKSFKSPKGVAVKELLVGEKIVTPYENLYDIQVIGYRNGACRSYLSGVVGEDPHPLARFYSKPEALEMQLIFEKWRLETIPGWRQTMQKYLNGHKVLLSFEQFLALKQLGFTIPQKWEEIK